METARCKAFLMSAETGSLSKAAEVLNYTPSGVSQLVSAFENELNLSLLRRTKKGVELTKDGEKIFPLVREFLDYENRIVELASEINGLLVGNITIASYFSVATHWLPCVIRDFRKKYPNVKIHIMEGIRQEIFKWIDDKIADVAFVTYKNPMPYDWITLAEDPMLAILHKDHPYAKCSSYPLKNCSEEDFIMPANSQDEDILEMFERNNLHPNVNFSTIDNFSTLSMVEQGLGMCIMNELITLRFQADVVKIPVDPPQHITLGIAVPSLKNTQPAVRRFIDYATDMLIKKPTQGACL